MNQVTKNTWRNIFSVLGGVVVALIIIIPLGLMGAVMLFSDAPIPEKDAITANSIMTIAVIIGSFVGGYTTVNIAINKKMVYFTAFILLFLNLLLYEFDLNHLTLIEVLFLVFIPVFVILGGYIAKRMINKKSYMI